MKQHKLYFTNFQIGLLIEGIDDINDDPVMTLTDKWLKDEKRLFYNLDSISRKLRGCLEGEIGDDIA